jgi:superfamily I DNA/RNA helicase
MRPLPSVTPSPEQLPLISSNKYGVEVIRGAAGSGKTSTAILRLRSQLYMVQERLKREGSTRLPKILVLTFNRTLRGYVKELAVSTIGTKDSEVLQIETFSKWAMNNLGDPTLVTESVRAAKIASLAGSITELTPRYIVDEVEYILGRYPSSALDDYLTDERTGRGSQPRVERSLRRRLLADVVRPYLTWLRKERLDDWNTIAERMGDRPNIGYDVVIIDEAQDFSANQLRAVRRHMLDQSMATLVIDTAQRIYSRGFTWKETGFEISPARYYRLVENHRNTKEIADFASGLLDGIAIDADGSLPNLAAAKKIGEKPELIVGFYSQQVSYAIDILNDEIDLEKQSVAFLSPAGGGYFTYLKNRLNDAGIEFADISRERDWPAGPENVAISTFHSAKGLEFDHVFILGLNEDITHYDDESKEDRGAVLRRLLAVAIARAKSTVTVGYKSSEKSRLIEFFKPGTFTKVKL